MHWANNCNSSGKVLRKHIEVCCPLDRDILCLNKVPYCAGHDFFSDDLNPLIVTCMNAASDNLGIKLLLFFLQW